MAVFVPHFSFHAVATKLPSGFIFALVMKNLILAGVLALCTTLLEAQTVYSEKEYKKHPLWIKLMDDTLSNYIETEKAFSLYFTAHELPHEEDEIIGMRSAEEMEKQNRESWLLRLFKKKRDLSETELAFAVKRYRHWTLMVAPWIQEDGSILYPSQRKTVLESISR